jgi:hypothetical protein
MPLTITSVWSRTRPREEQAQKLVSAGRLAITNRGKRASDHFRVADNVPDHSLKVALCLPEIWQGPIRDCGRITGYVEVIPVNRPHH